MDAEPSVILRRSTTATSSAPRGMTAVEALVPSRTSRTEGTVVFIGRASFQMVPAVYATRDAADAVQAETPVLVTPAPTVVLVGGGITPGPIVQEPVPQAEAAAPSKTADAVPAGAVMRLFSAADVTEPIQARPRAARSRRRLINGRTVRSVLLALVTGATITLSAEAVMRRPPATATLPTLAPVAPPPAAAAPVAAPTPSVATVVASTVNAPRPEPTLSATESASAPVPARATHKRSRVRPVPVTRRLAAVTATTGAKTLATWVDPFAPPEANPTVVPAPNRAAGAAWVDPFAN